MHFGGMFSTRDSGLGGAVLLKEGSWLSSFSVILVCWRFRVVLFFYEEVTSSFKIFFG